MAAKYEEKDMFLYLDFQGKVSTESIEKESTFFRIADIDGKNPLVQLNDMIYKGTVEDCVGTNLFFTEENRPPNTECFMKGASISLKYLLSQNKILNLKCVKLNSCSEIVSDDTELEINLNQDYNAALTKLAAGEINLEDLLIVQEDKDKSDKKGSLMVTNETQKNVSEETPNDKEVQQTESTAAPVSLEKTLEDIPPVEIPEKPSLFSKYEKLCKLARRPVYREREPEDIEKCEAKYEKAFEYHNIERQIFQRSDSFPILDFTIDEKDLENAVDVDRSILYNIIQPVDIKSTLILDENLKNKLFSIENFANLSLPARYVVLKRELDNLQKTVDNSTEEQLKELDEFGRTATDTLELFKKLVRHLGNYLNKTKTSLSNYMDEEMCKNK